MSPDRANRVADFIRAELADIVRNKMRDPRIVGIAVNQARVSRDLSYADVYVSSLDAESGDAKRELVAALNHAAGFLRSAVAQRHTLRTTPRLRFHYDDLVDEGPRLDALIDHALRSDAAHSGM